MSKLKVIKFREDLKEYRDLLRKSTGSMLNIEINKTALEKLKSLLIAQFAEIEDEISEFSRQPSYADPVWRIPQDAYQLSLSNDILQRRLPAIEATLNDLDYVIAKLNVKGRKITSSTTLDNTKATTVISIDSLHHKIITHCKSRYDSGHYSDAIFNAYKVILNEIKEITGITDKEGKSLVETALSLNKPLIKLNPLISQSDKDEQQGFMLLYSGAALGIRNPKAHDLVIQDDPFRALQYISFASLLLNRLDERIAPDGISNNG